MLHWLMLLVMCCMFGDRQSMHDDSASTHPKYVQILLLQHADQSQQNSESPPAKRQIYQNILTSSLSTVLRVYIYICSMHCFRSVNKRCDRGQHNIRCTCIICSCMYLLEIPILPLLQAGHTEKPHNWHYQSASADKLE